MKERFRWPRVYSHTICLYSCRGHLDEKTFDGLKKLSKVWRERRVFDPREVDALQQLLSTFFESSSLLLIWLWSFYWDWEG